MRALIQEMRPKQWAKNVFVFAGIFFDGRVFDAHRLLRSVTAFVIFCLLSSAIYLINDLLDVEKDRLHPVKRNRPLASGALHPGVAIAAAAILLAVSLPLALWLDPYFGLVALAYTLVMLLYSTSLKHIVIIDVMTIATGFVLRVIGGTTVAQVTRFSPWLYVCTTLLALFLAINKRRHELILLADEANNHRSALQNYTVAYLDDMNALVMATALAAYSFYTFSAPNAPANHSMMLTIPFVMYGLFRYLFLVRVRGLGGAPEDIALGDAPLLIDVLLWGIVAGLAIYLPTLF